MGDESPLLPNPIGELQSITEPTVASVQAELDGTGPVVIDCTQAVAEAEDAITADIQSCLNACHGDIGLCHSCILGDITDYINRAGLSVTQCGDKIVSAVNAAVSQSWLAATAFGIPPPTQLQIQAALSGQPIPEADSPQTISVADGEQIGHAELITGVPTTITTIGNGSGTITSIGPTQTQLITLPRDADGNVCIPHDWTEAQIVELARAAYGNDQFGHFARKPTQDLEGVWNDSLGDHPLPKLCVAQGGYVTIPPSDETFPRTGQIIAIPAPPGGTQGQIIAIPSLPPAQGQIIATQCPPPQVNVYTPSCPAPTTAQIVTQQTPTPPCPEPPAKSRCLVCYVDGTYAIIDSDDPSLASLPDGAKIAGCSTDDSELAALGEKCGVTVVLPPPPEATVIATITQPNLGNLCDPNYVYNFTSHVDNYNAAVVGQTDAVIASIAGFIGLTIANAITKLTGVTDAKTTLLNFITSVFGAGIGAGNWKLLKKLLAPVGGGDTCYEDAFFAANMQKACTAAFGGWFGMMPDATRRSWEYAANSICPNQIPSTGELNRLFSRGYITQPNWDAAVKANADCPPWQEKIIDSTYTRIGIADAFRLFTLGKIDNNEWETNWKRQGIDVNREKELWRQTIQQYPGMADLIRMMVRDVGDPDVVSLLGLDAEFNDKWKDSEGLPLKTWGESQGVQDSVARAYWRAHWQAPSPGQIYEWLHRLRPDDRDPRDPNINVTLSEEKAAKLLQIADYVPGLVQNYIATAYRPVTRRDISRLYRIGVFKDEDAVRRAYRDLGHTDIAATDIARATALIEKPAIAKLHGELSANEVITQYKNNLLTNNEALQLLLTAGLSNEQALTTLEATDVRKRSASRTIVVKSLRQRYFMGEFTDAEASQQLSDAFMDLGNAADTVKLWNAERRAKQKSITVAVLCKWYGRGQISLQDYLQRVNNLNYSSADALRIVESCQMDIQAKRQKEIEAALARQQKEQQAANRQAAKALRDARAQARTLKLQHIIKHKVSTKTAKGVTTTTTTDDIVDKPDDNITSTQEHIDVTTL